MAARWSRNAGWWFASAAVLVAGCGGGDALPPPNPTPIGAAATSDPTPAIVGSTLESSSAIQHTIGPDRWTVTTPRGSGVVPVFDSAPLPADHTAVTRIVLIVHGETRDAGQYYDDVHRGALDKAALTSTLIVAPQFLNLQDVQDRKNALPSTILGWHVDDYSDGDDAEAPAAISSFDVLDSLIASFTDRAAYPALRTIVLAGHSGGAQLMQRYAVVGSAFASASAKGYDVRFVIASPSSFLYFDTLRPSQRGSFTTGGSGCPTFNDWRFGLQAPPRYVNASVSAASLFTAYAHRNVTYFSGSKDVDPSGSIDQSCMAEEQGRTRVARASNYEAYLAQRSGGTSPHALVTVAGVGHSDVQMLTSAEVESALFGP